MKAYVEWARVKEYLGRTPLLKELYKTLQKRIKGRFGSDSAYLETIEAEFPSPRQGKGDRKAKFRALASKAALEYNRKGKWSSLELKWKEYFAKEFGLEEGKDYVHNLRVSDPKNRTYYELDFWFPGTESSFPFVIEVSPRIWHQRLGNTEQKDARKRRFVEVCLAWRYYEFPDEPERHAKALQILLSARRRK